ncbi:MAG: hypothetical protein EON58_21925 [Alphaproteobacteria bacterium]|nr:MAG: hypothetical protein EON58_21925 [Alphaproteobacteria bacterium]
MNDSPHISISVSKGGNVSLMQTAAKVDKLFIGLGWSVPSDEAACDIDASAFLLGENNLVRSTDDDEITPKRGMSFWGTVIQVEFTDIIFAVDSILVAVALVHNPQKIWVVYAGGFLGILLLRLAASFFIRLITKYPALDHMAYGLVGWAGIKLASSAMDIRADSLNLREPHFLPQWAFWVGFVLITVFGSLYAVRRARTADDEERCDTAEESLDCLTEGEFIDDPLPPPGPRPTTKK